MTGSVKPLFSQHYLTRRLPETQDWETDVTQEWQELQQLYQQKQAILPTCNEAQTEEEFIKPVLDRLGFTYTVQASFRRGGRVQRPDYTLFGDESSKQQAQQGETHEFFLQGLAVADAKYWERPLGEKLKNDPRDTVKNNSNPSFQIISYLDGTRLDWGILTNGRIWRLYYRQSRSPIQQFYEIDLVNLLEEGEIDSFKYFWLFFRKEAFIPDVQGNCFLERVLQGSGDYARLVEGALKQLVFNQIFPAVAGEFVGDITAKGEEVNCKELYAATLSFLYKILFLLYAEARVLLPIDQDYRSYSLTIFLKEIAGKIDTQRKLSETSTRYYDSLLSLFRIIDQGDPSLNVPAYNGGLFKITGEGTELSPENRFLLRYRVADAVLAPALDQLARINREPIDYGFIGVRDLGTIYEGLLEYKIIIDDAAAGRVHLENDKGERKQTGSYYTPDYIVQYIVENTLEPIITERGAKFSELMTQLQETRKRLQDGRNGAQTIRGLRKDLQKLEREAWETLLDIKVFDPAMGSGHFLVATVDFITDQLILMLNDYPEENPVLERLEGIRQEILENLQGQGIPVNPKRLSDDNLLHRAVMKRCIYGVDLNPMAVELAKVSLWLHSFTIGAPLSFLDHHLRCGNSLIGATARETENRMQADEGGQLSLLQGPFAGLLGAANVMREIANLSDATFQEVERSQTYFKQFDRAAKPYKRLLDVFVSQFFGVKGAQNFLERYGERAVNLSQEGMSGKDREILQDARELYQEKRFFHWDLEFPEVFIDLDSASWKDNPGFDAVVGNPPYDELSENALGRKIDEKLYLKANPIYEEAMTYRINLYRLFIATAIDKLRDNGYHGFIVPISLLGDRFTFQLRSKIFQNYNFICIECFPQKDDPKNRVFFDAKLPTCIYILNKNKTNSRFLVRTHVGKNILAESQNYKVSIQEIQDFDSKNLSIPTVNHEDWKIALNLCENEKLCCFCDITSSSPGEIMFNKQFQKFLSDNKNTGKVVLRGAHIGRYEFYQHPKQGKPIFIDKQKYLKERGKSKASKAYDHLKLRIGYQRGSAIDNYRRLIATTIEKGNFCSDTVGYFVDAEYNLYTMLAFLNSKIIEWRFRMTSTTNHVNPYEIDVIRIPKISFTTPPETRTKNLNQLTQLYQENLPQLNPNPILTQVQNELEQNRNDIIHDFLAYLAEQMLTLNQQKQAEISDFLTYLAREIGTEIDNLTNKTKIKNYLGDYQKQEPHLSFNDVLKILKKNQKKLQIDPSERKTQNQLAQEYENSLNVLLPLKMQLENTDSLIDQIVYKLYGLTEEEIAIIENN